MVSAIGSTIQRRRILIQGIVQGVGFRPFVYGQALRWGLVGFVLNNSLGVTIEVEGSSEALDRFQRTLREEAPPLARIDSLVTELITPCHDCLRELFDPRDRRYLYPFTNCTNCGPRFTIIQDVPYDRDKTTMRVFPMCPSCRREYEDPLNRRFHAQPNACPVCGPHVALLSIGEDGAMHPVVCQDPIIQAAQLLATGTIVAVK